MFFSFTLNKSFIHLLWSKIFVSFICSSGLLHLFTKVTPQQCRHPKLLGSVVVLQIPRKLTCSTSFNNVGSYKIQISVELCWKQRWKQLCWKKYVETTWIFRPLKLHRKKYVETMWIFRQSKLHQKKYVETTWIFRPSKWRRQKYVETTWIFRSAKLPRKSLWKWRGNSSKFGLGRIDVISTSTWSARWDITKLRK